MNFLNDSLIINKVKNLLPRDLQYIVISFIPKKYIFDKDSVYFNINPRIIDEKGKLRINIFSWFGTHIPKFYKTENILHTIYDRPYSIKLKRTFFQICKYIFQEIEKFDFPEYSCYYDYFGGTFGPIQKYKSEQSLRFNKFSSHHWFCSPDNNKQYFRDLNINDKDDNIRKNKLLNMLTESIKKGIEKYNFITNNNIKFCNIKKIILTQKFFTK